MYYSVLDTITGDEIDCGKEYILAKDVQHRLVHKIVHDTFCNMGFYDDTCLDLREAYEQIIIIETY